MNEVILIKCNQSDSTTYIGEVQEKLCYTNSRI